MLLETDMPFICGNYCYNLFLIAITYCPCKSVIGILLCLCPPFWLRLFDKQEEGVTSAVSTKVKEEAPPLPGQEKGGVA